MRTLLVNCEKLPFGPTLGVASVLLSITRELAKTHKVVFAVPDMNEFAGSAAAAKVTGHASVITLQQAAAETATGGDRFIEILPHHFQPPRFCRLSIGICHDLHVFDIGWKYPDLDAVRAEFRQVATSTTVVMTHFPRTYYDLERVAGINVRHLFLTCSPLMLDTSAAFGASAKTAGGRFLLYPAQLQAHKNHAALIRPLAALRREAPDVRLLCPGSEFGSHDPGGIKKAIESHGLGSAVQFLGRVSDAELLQLYRDCTGVIVPSMAEGGAYVAMEAIAAGKPVAVNTLPSARAHLRAVGADVVWFDANSESSILGAMRSLLNGDPKANLDANAEARRRIAATTWADVAAQWRTVIEWLDGTRLRPICQVSREGSDAVLF